MVFLTLQEHLSYHLDDLNVFRFHCYVLGVLVLFLLRSSMREESGKIKRLKLVNNLGLRPYLFVIHLHVDAPSGILLLVYL